MRIAQAETTNRPNEETTVDLNNQTSQRSDMPDGIERIDAEEPSMEHRQNEPWLNIVLFKPEIPYNAGNAGRTCVALGAKLWMVRPLGFVIDSKHIRRAGLDYWQHLDYQVVDDWQQLCSLLPLERMWFFTKKAERPHTDARFSTGDALVFGSESRGLPDEILSLCPERCLRLPMRPLVRSLNLAVSVGVAAYEAWRQLGGAGDIR